MLSKKLIITSLLISLFSNSLFFVSSAGAQEKVKLGMKVNPQIFEIDVWPGEKMENKIKITNTSNVSLPIKIRTADFTAQEYSGEMIFDEALQDPSIASRKWFALENPEFILEPEEMKEINFVINVPESAELGGHYAVMFFEPLLPSFYFEEEQVRSVPILGVLFLISVKSLSLNPETGKKLEIIEFSLPKEERLVRLENILSDFIGPRAQASQINIVQSSPSSFVLKIKNSDIYHVKPSGRVLVYDFFGRKVGEVKVEKNTILPGKVRDFPVEFSPQIPEKLKWLPSSVSDFFINNFFVGEYKAELQLKVESPLKAEIAQSDVYDKLIFFSLPSKFLLFISFILVFFVFISIKHRKRIKLALKALFQSNT